MQYDSDETLRENRKRMEQLQQASLLCKLFNKQVCITWTDEIGCRNATTSLFLVSARTVILKEGRFIPL
jgi:hypothetical protein